eukprot:COSAG01_NODE_9454_length_2443_cov_1.701365_1_plen_203_part_00
MLRLQFSQLAGCDPSESDDAPRAWPALVELDDICHAPQQSSQLGKPVLCNVKLAAVGFVPGRRQLRQGAPSASVVPMGNQLNDAPAHFPDLELGCRHAPATAALPTTAVAGAAARGWQGGWGLVSAAPAASTPTATTLTPPPPPTPSPAPAASSMAAAASGSPVRRHYLVDRRAAFRSPQHEALFARFCRPAASDSSGRRTK